LKNQTKYNIRSLCGGPFALIWVKSLYLILIALFLLTGVLSQAQAPDRLMQLKSYLDTLALDVPGLNQNIQLTVSRVPIQEFVRNIANSNQINISIDPSLKYTVTNNFVDVPAKDVLLYLSKEYELEMTIVGKIISIHQWEAPYIDRLTSNDIQYDIITDLIMLDLDQDSLQAVARAMTRITGSNIIFTPEVQNRVISVYVENLPLDQALNKMALSNNLRVSGEDGVFLIDQLDPNNNGTHAGRRSKISSGQIYYNARNKDDINIFAAAVPIHDIVAEVSKKLNINYFLYSDLEGEGTVNLQAATYDQLLENLLNGTEYTYGIESGIYMIGSRDMEGLRRTELVSMQFRSVSGISEAIPSPLQQGVSIKEFHELNSLIISGSYPMILEIKNFLSDIDQVVPLIMIEVLIVNNQTGFSISTGIEAGIGKSPAESGGTFLSGVDYTFNSNSITKILNSFNAFGIANLGKVTPNFYVTLKAMEEQGMIKVTSTPKLSTLNGHEANMKIGNTEYYIEETSDFVVTQSTQERTTIRYQSVSADFILTILPIVAGDEHITLEIKVEQTDFTDRIEKTAPPGQVTRSFTSMIRVKNEEMVLLGGLEVNSQKDQGRGIPLLSRIPVIKWLFSSREKEKKDEKLNVFIKPTIYL
jgi:type IV pilus assembly protein PilQ